MHRAAHLRVNLFPAYANQVYWVAIGVVAAAIAVAPAALIAWARSPYATGQGEPPEQPIKFDHRHHVRDDGITCEYCHGGVERSPFAGIPATSVCVNCHAQVWTASPELAEVRRSYFANEPIRWLRVNALPDFVFFDHSAHVTKGVGCVSCHGRVDTMGQVYQAAPLTMRWCLDCHREPEGHLRPLDAITDMEWAPDPARAKELGRELRASLGVRSVVECSGCHR